MNIILSIHPKWAKLIYEGEKTIEWRKTFPLRADKGDIVYIYETAPIKKITGSFIFNEHYLLDAYEKSWIDQYKERGIDIIGSGCVPIDELQKYQNNGRCLHGWCCAGALRFDTPKSLEEFGLKRPPQSWQFTEANV